MTSRRIQPLPRRTRRSPFALAASFSTMLVVVFCLVPLAVRAGSDKAAPPPSAANEYAAYDSHSNEHVSIAAEPCDDPNQCSFFRLPYIQHGFLPVRVFITNDSDAALSLEDARIQFISAHNDTIPAATEDEINRRLFTLKNAKGTKIPIIPVTIHHPVDKKIVDDDNDFGFKSTVVHAHSTLAGYLFYDIRDLDEPALKGAELYVKMVHTLDKTRELFAFSVPFDKWLAANPNAPSNHPRR